MGCTLLTEDVAFRQVTQDVLDHKVSLLHVLGTRVGNGDVQVSQLRQPAAGSGERDRAYSHVPGQYDRIDDVGRVAARADSNEEVPSFAERLDLAGENALEIEVVGEGSEERGIGRQSQDGQGFPWEIGREPAHELGREMLAVGGAPSVPLAKPRRTGRRATLR